MAQPGSSSVFYGGTVSYNTQRARPLLLNDAKLHETLTKLPSVKHPKFSERYVQSKVEHTQHVAKAYCEKMGTDYAIAESGASGPTFRPSEMNQGFAAIAVARRDEDTGVISIVKQDVIRSNHNNRVLNMRIFADGAAKLALEAIEEDTVIGASSRNASDTTSSHSSSPQADGDEDGYAYHLDRATKLRTNAEALSKMEKQAKYVVLRGGQSLFTDESLSELNFLDYNKLQSIINATGAKVNKTFLGILNEEQVFFAADLFGGNEDFSNEDYHFSDTRTGAPLLSPLHNELALHAMALAQWQRKNKYCTVCGSKTELIHGNTCLKCSSCDTMSWPRQDPSMICAVTSRSGDHILLAHSPRHPPMLHTVLAGFIEAGESFEKGVAREVYEECGIRIDPDSVEYIGSQPWPFPQSCMIGFRATADETQALNIDEDELVMARWFHKEEVRAASLVEGATMRRDVAQAAVAVDPSLSLLIPPKGVIARRLIDTWLDTLPL